MLTLTIKFMNVGNIIIVRHVYFQIKFYIHTYIHTKIIKNMIVYKIWSVILKYNKILYLQDNSKLSFDELVVWNLELSFSRTVVLKQRVLQALVTFMIKYFNVKTYISNL